MKDGCEGWTIQDLEGELLSLGVSMYDVLFIDIIRQLNCETAEEAARHLFQEQERR